MARRTKPKRRGVAAPRPRGKPDPDRLIQLLSRTPPPQLTFRWLDTVLGGPRLQGYKTLIGITGWAVLSIGNTTGLIPTSEITQTLQAIFASYAGLSLVAKIERRTA